MCTLYVFCVFPVCFANSHGKHIIFFPTNILGLFKRHINVIIIMIFMFISNQTDRKQYCVSHIMCNTCFCYVFSVLSESS